MSPGSDCLRNKAFHIFSEVIVRAVLIAIFCVLENRESFERLIQPEEWWLYKNPSTISPHVSTLKLYLIAIFSPPITILVFSGIRMRNDVLPALLASTLALTVNGVLTNAVKLSVGRPRPDFFFRCFKDGVVPEGQPSTFNLQCTGDRADIIEGRKSFPSGHSSFAFVSLGFCAIYMAGKLQCFTSGGQGKSWRLCTCLIPLLMATLTAISRTCDYMHHWQDVTVGSIMGLSITYMSYRQYYPPLSAPECSIPYMHSLPAVKSSSNLYEVVSSGTKVM
uniref:Phosphatidic acid phosphatase type 2/haloperoxidase domain-containing protein n=1 Tax=Ciona savignyi TaxID=51511 RepID=H2ZLP3_CIOSA